MGRHVIEARHTVLAYDVNPGNLACMVSLGAQEAVSPKAVVQVCNIVFSSLPVPREVEQVALGKDLRLALEMGDQLSVPLTLGGICVNLMRQIRANGQRG